MMNTKINFHTHTNFSDGANTPEEMVLSAIQKGISILGFSDHSMFPFGGKWHIGPKDIPLYVKTIRELAQKYKDKITIKCGFEADYYPTLTIPSKDLYKEFAPDFLIGSVHYIATSNGHYTMDHKPERVKRGVDILYNGDGKKAVCDYFEAQRFMLEHGDFDIWGHPDLFRKRNAELKLFDENESWYKEELVKTAKVAAKAGVIAEINTGAIGRGAMQSFYPSEQFLQIIHDNGIPVMINSDSHNVDTIDCAFDQAVEYIKKAGYQEIHYPDSGSFVSIKI